MDKIKDMKEKGIRRERTQERLETPPPVYRSRMKWVKMRKKTPIVFYWGWFTSVICTALVHFVLPVTFLVII